MRYSEILLEKKSSSTSWVILYTDSKLILGKRSPTVNNPNLWNFFGGHQDPGENAERAAVRELYEETGYILSVGALRFITKIGDASYFTAKISDPGSLGTSEETSKIREYNLAHLPDNLHAKTAIFFDQLDILFN